MRVGYPLSWRLLVALTMLCHVAHVCSFMPNAVPANPRNYRKPGAALMQLMASGQSSPRKGNDADVKPNRDGHEIGPFMFRENVRGAARVLALGPPGSKRRGVARCAKQVVQVAGSAAETAVASVFDAADAAVEVAVSTGDEFKRKVALELEENFYRPIDELLNDVRDQAFAETFSNRPTSFLPSFESNWLPDFNTGEDFTSYDDEKDRKKRAEVLQEQRRQRLKENRQATQLSNEQVLEIFHEQPSPSVSIWRSSRFGFNKSASTLRAELAQRYAVTEAVIQRIWSRTVRISTTRPHWTDQEFYDDMLMRNLNTAKEATIKSTPTHQREVSLNLWAQKYLELQAQLEVELEEQDANEDHERTSHLDDDSALENPCVWEKSPVKDEQLRRLEDLYRNF